VDERSGAMSTTTDPSAMMLAAVVFGSVGFAYFVYGKRQQAPFPLITGLALCIFPYFVSNTYLMIGLGLGLSALPWLMRR